jgi:hypothetical protein
MGMLFRFRPSQLVSYWILFSLGTFLVAGCDGSLDVSQPPSTTPLPTCQVTEKFYMSEDGAFGTRNRNANKIANEIYNLSQPPSNNLDAARNEAIDFLTYETKRWSNFEELKWDDNNSVRVMLTFISPELVRAVLVNHVLLNTTQSPLTGLTFEQYSNQILTDMDTQNRYMFLIAIQPVSTNESKETFIISVSQAVLMNNGGTTVKVIHHDNFLDQTFNFTTEPHAGFLYYPFGTKNDTCKRVLDPVRDTSITLSLNGQLGKTEIRTVTLDIPFSSPLQVAGVIPSPNPNLGLSPEQEKPFTNIKDLQLIKPAETDPYWQVMGRFIWEKLTDDHFYQP